MNTWQYRNHKVALTPERRLAVKNNIDLAGVPTSVGNRWLKERSTLAPPVRDAECVVRLRAAGYHVAGATNLHELCHGGSGVNPWFGTPENPLDPTRIPGGSSSGSAVAVARGEADVAFGTDTAGSVRTPAAYCGVVGLKAGTGLISTAGVWPLSVSLDAVGLLGATVGSVGAALTAMALGLDPFAGDSPLPALYRMRVPDVEPAIDAAVDRVVAALGAHGTAVEHGPVLPGWVASATAANDVFFAEANRSWWWLLEQHPDDVGADVAARLHAGRAIDVDAERAARRVMAAWRDELIDFCADATRFVVLPTRAIFPPTIEAVSAPGAAPGPPVMTLPVNAAGCPAVAVPIAARAGAGDSVEGLPASMQIVGPPGSELELLRVAAAVEQVADWSPPAVSPHP